MNFLRIWCILSLLLVLSLVPVTAQTIEIQPEAPPGVGEKLSTVLGWVYWLAIVACIAAIIVGIVMIATGGDRGKEILIGGIIGLIFLLALNEIISTLGG